MDTNSESKNLLILGVILIVLAIGVFAAALWQGLVINEQNKQLQKIIGSYTAQSLPPFPAETDEEDVLVAPGEERIVRGDEPTTYLHDMTFGSNAIKEAECKSFAELIGEDRIRLALEEADLSILEDDRVIEHFRTLVGDETETFIERLQNADLITDRNLDLICEVNEEIWVTATTGIRSPKLYKWTKSEAGSMYFKTHDPDIHTVALSYGFYPDVDGEMFAVSAYGDAGVIWWRFYQYDPGASYFDLVEECTLANIFDEEVGDFSESRELSCSREYRP